MKLKTLKGSIIERSKHGVGKQMGHQTYVHHSYAGMVVPHCMLKAYSRCLPEDFKYQTIMFDKKAKTIRFDEAPDFDTAREPHAGITYKVHEDGKVKRRIVNQIWHHKWLWVDDDYEGFDVKKSVTWSKKWLGKLNETANGYLHIWEKQLKSIGL